MNKLRWRTLIAVAVIASVVAVAILMTRNASRTSFHYGVHIINEGDDLIEVERFDLYDDPYADVDVGLVYPGITKGMSPFFQVPQATHRIRWKNRVTGKDGEAVVRIKLPDGFMKTGRFIKIYLNPHKNSARVAFTLEDGNTGEFREIQ